MSVDTLIYGGMIVDGTGNPAYRGALGIRNGRLLMLRGDIDQVDAHRRVDAKGMIVAPGFIDMHSHSGLMVLAYPSHEAKVRQGVTTEVIGVDGNSYAPFDDPEELAAFVRLNSGLDGRPNISFDWSTVASYLSRFDRQVAVNIAFLVGNSALRIGSVGWDDRPATDKTMGQMASMLREAMEEGSFGMSTGLDYPPGAFASTDELVALGRVAGHLGGIYHTHVRYQLGDRFLDPFREAIEIGRRGDVPVHLTHMYRRSTDPGGALRMLDLVDEAVSKGFEVTFDSYPYEWSSTRLLILIPIALQGGGPDEIKARLSDKSNRHAIREAIEARAIGYRGSHVWNTIRLGAFGEANAEYEGRSIAEVARMRDQHPADAICDLLVSEDLGVNEVAVGPDGASIPTFVTHSRGMVGSDSVFIGERPSPRTFGTFPRILGEFVREERRLSITEAVRKMTSFPAQRLGISDRGMLQDNMVADIVVFDADSVRATASYENPRQFPVGIQHVVVSGEFVLSDGQMTGALPGRALRHRRPDR